MNIKLKWFFAGLLFVGSLYLVSCNGDDDDDDTTSPSGKIVFDFEHYYDGVPVEFDKMQYTNEAGNLLEFSVIQWFISDVTLHYVDGKEQTLDQWTFYHYIDTDIPSTLKWEVEDNIQPGQIESISFVFGLRGEKNIPYQFVNYPENAMFWPYHLGGDHGGYHYMKINGFWMKGQTREIFEMHLGVGQAQDSNGVRIKDSTGSYVFVQNWFEVTLPQSSFTLDAGKTKEIAIRMNIEEWMKNPNTYDFNIYGNTTMENQRAMQALKENGQTVFSIGYMKDL